MNVRIERRLSQPKWLKVAVPAGSLVIAFLLIAVLLLATGHNPWTTYKELFDAAFTAPGALSQTLIGATPLVFTGLAAAAAFRMNLFNIGGEGQLYFGAIGASAAGLLLGGQPTVVILVAMIAGGVASGAGWGLIPGIFRGDLLAHQILPPPDLKYRSRPFPPHFLFSHP